MIEGVQQSQGRLLSLDAFRGATIAAMVLVNDPGSSEAYPQLQHSRWNGWTFTDWIFPFFLFIVGVAMTFSFARRLEQGADKRKLLAHALLRGAVIAALGLFVNGFPFWLDPNFSLSTWRIPGVLQRIGICYIAATLIYLRTSVRGQVAWAVSLLAAYWLLVKTVPVPGYGAGVLEPKGSLPWFIDSNLLGGHTWVYAPAPGFDPEGILSNVPAVATTLLGVLTGSWLRSTRSKEEKTAWMFTAGMVLLLLGTIADMWLPINKNLWTSSYVLFMGGWSLVCLATMYWLIDVRGHSKWAAPFVIFGMNAIAVYVLSETASTALWELHWRQPGGQTTTLHEFLYTELFAPLARPIDASLLFAVAFVLAMYVTAWALWRKKWFLKV